jgi:hypothetical protein
MVQLRLKRLQQEVAQYPQYFYHLTMQRPRNSFDKSHEYSSLEIMVCMVDGGIDAFYTCSKVTSRLLM